MRKTDTELPLAFSVASMAMVFISSFPFLLVESASPGDLTDRESLLSFKSLVSDPSGTLSSWNDSSHVCEWVGVSCNKLRQRVTMLDLQGLGLSGLISPQVGNISFLHTLYLQDNRLSGVLPDQIGGLHRLQVLNVSSNLIQGTIPPNVSKCTELTVLDLSGNMIPGGIPSELALLKELQILKLGRNQLTGLIPPSIGNLSSLSMLDLGTTFLSGSIPSDLGRLRSLQYLQLSINNLTGTVPPALYNLSSLTYFDLASNYLRGEIPRDIGFRLPNLLVFHFCINVFTGLIPPSLHNITKLQSLRLSRNFLVGPVPPGLGNLPDLTMYAIGLNRIFSSDLSFVTSLTNSSKLRRLAINGNLLEGVIPESVGNLSASLSRLHMGGNKILGSMPASVGRLTSLTLLDMSHNFISGEIPPEISQLNELQMLGLAGNKLLGEIPAGLGNLSKLTKLELYGNNLDGGIPSTFSNYQRLLTLDISSNELNGSIPRDIFTLTGLSSLLNLSKNHLTGPLPEEVGNLVNVVTIDLSDNFLSGDIPDAIGDCKSLQALIMSNNSFSGHVPDELGNLKGLQSLDLSSNQLSGSIPSDLGGLLALQFLNLSFNNLEGKLPRAGVFQNLSGVHLQGNPNLCVAASSSCGNESSHRRIYSLAYRILIMVAALVSLCILLGLLWFFFVRRERDARVLSVSDTMKGHHQQVSYEELLEATNKFDARNLIGLGGFGSVYKGVLKDGMAVAIKVLNLGTNGASKSFLAECEVLRNVRHRKLVKLVTSCSSVDFANNEFLAIVYELMRNGSLEDWVHGKRRHEDGDVLNLAERLNIAIDVASAMDYLHNDCEAPVVHCDLKPSNVLLDEEMMAKVGDFGLARMLVQRVGNMPSATSTHGIKGSIGYIAPEYGLGVKPSTRGDIYSYGVLLLELLTGKSPTDEIFEGQQSLQKWVRAAFPGRVMEVLDPNLLLMHDIILEGQSISPEKQQGCLLSTVKVGLACATRSPEARITMRDAINLLKDIKSTLLMPHMHAFHTLK